MGNQVIVLNTIFITKGYWSVKGRYIETETENTCIISFL